MPPPTSRSAILASLRDQIAKKKPIVGAGAGIGLSAKFLEIGGADLIIICTFRLSVDNSITSSTSYFPLKFILFLYHDSHSCTMGANKTQTIVDASAWPAGVHSQD